jgi:hypothetical protein
MHVVKGLKGLVPNGHTGEIMALFPDERARVTRIVAEEVSGFSGQVSGKRGKSKKGPETRNPDVSPALRDNVPFTRKPETCSCLKVISGVAAEGSLVARVSCRLAGVTMFMD